jgi:hypothetical protein
MGLTQDSAPRTLSPGSSIWAAVELALAPGRLISEACLLSSFLPVLVWIFSGLLCLLMTLGRAKVGLSISPPLSPRLLNAN